MLVLESKVLLLSHYYLHLKLWTKIIKSALYALLGCFRGATSSTFMYRVKNELDWVYVLAHFNGICENCGYCDGGVCGGFTIYGVCKLLWGIPIRQVCKLSWNEGVQDKQADQVQVIARLTCPRDSLTAKMQICK